MRIRNALRVIQEFIVEPLLLAFGIFIIFPHFQYVYNNTMPYKVRIEDVEILVKGMCEDMKMYPIPYIVFGIILLVWISLKAYRFYSDQKSEKELKQSIDNLPKKIAEELKINELPQKIIDALKTPSNASQTDMQNEQTENNEKMGND